LRYELRHLPGNIHAHPPITTPTQQNEPPDTKRTRFSTTPLWLHETNRPPNVTLNPPTSPTARPATPTFDDCAPFTAHGDVRQAPTTTAPQHPPFSPLDEHPHPSHLKPPQNPHLAPPPFSAPPASKRATTESPPHAQRPPQHATRTNGASAEPLEANDVNERETKETRIQNSKTRQRHSDDAPTVRTGVPRPQHYVLMNTNQKKHWNRYNQWNGTQAE
jgi:hypothetical protein